MTQPTPSLPFYEQPARVLPLRGSRAYGPSSVLVRARLRESLDVSRVRAVVAIFAEACEFARLAHGAEERWWTQPVELRVDQLADRAALPLKEAEVAVDDLEAAGLIQAAERGFRLDGDVLCENSILHTYDWDEAKERVRSGGRLVAPAIALLRELVRLCDPEGVVRTTFPRLLDDVLYGRTRLTQALSVLEGAGLVERRDLPGRTVQITLRRDVSSASAGRPPLSSQGSRTKVVPQSQRMRLPTNAPIEIAGEPVEVPPGMSAELERSDEGRYYLWIGPVRIGPYDV